MVSHVSLLILFLQTIKNSPSLFQGKRVKKTISITCQEHRYGSDNTGSHLSVVLTGPLRF